jgi:hypothetical protein
MSDRITEGSRFQNVYSTASFTPAQMAADVTNTTANNSLGFALTEMRMVEPARATSIDTQTIHFNDTYLTWGETPLTTAHYGNFVPEFTSSATTASFDLGSPTKKWDDIYLNLKQDNIVSASGVENKFVRMDINSGKLTFTSASAGGGSSGLQIGTTGTTALAGNTALLQIGTTGTTALAGNTTIPSNTFRTVTVDTTGNGSANATLGSTETLMLKKGSNITLTEDDGAVTISATAGGTGTVIGSGSNGKIAFWNDTNKINSNSTLTYSDLTRY